MKPIIMKHMFACILITFSIAPIALCADRTSANKDTTKKESSIQVTAQTNAGTQQFSVKITPVPADGLVLNLEAPWRLVVVSSTGVTPVQSKLGLEDLKNNKGTWDLKGALDRKSNRHEIKIKADVFVCTKDKKTCFRNVHEETVKI